MNLLKRVLVALVFVPVICYALYSGGLFLEIFLSIVGVLAFFEINKINKFSFINNFIFSSIFLSIVFFHLDVVNFVSILLPLFFLFSLIKNRESDNYDLFSTKHLILLGASLYVIFPIILTFKGYKSAGFNYGIFLFGNIWINDSFAYFTGRLFGKHKFSKLLSPKKSMEGFLGGMFFSLIFSLIYVLNFNFITLKIALLSAIVISVFGPFGDLFESAIKRKFGIKDSSNIIPGHGGILDRFDSFFMAAPIYFFIITEVSKYL